MKRHQTGCDRLLHNTRRTSREMVVVVHSEPHYNSSKSRTFTTFLQLLMLDSLYALRPLKAGELKRNWCNVMETNPVFMLLWF